MSCVTQPHCLLVQNTLCQIADGLTAPARPADRPTDPTALSLTNHAAPQIYIRSSSPKKGHTGRGPLPVPEGVSGDRWRRWRSETVLCNRPRRCTCACVGSAGGQPQECRWEVDSGCPHGAAKVRTEGQSGSTDSRPSESER